MLEKTTSGLCGLIVASKTMTSLALLSCGLYPLSWPGWQRRWARRSKRAQREFVDRIGRAAQVYGPVRAEVARRYEEVHAEREAEKRALAGRRSSVGRSVCAHGMPPSAR